MYVLLYVGPSDVFIASCCSMHTCSSFLLEISHFLLIDARNIHSHNFKCESMHTIIQPWNRFASLGYCFCHSLDILIVYAL